MAGVELEQYATGNEMSNQQSEKQSFPIIPLAMECQVNDEKRQIFPKTRQTWENGWLPTTSQLHCFALCNLYLGAF